MLAAGIVLLGCCVTYAIHLITGQDLISMIGVLSGAVKTMFKKWIGYDINAYASGSAQTDDTKFWLFAILSACTPSLMLSI